MKFKPETQKPKNYLGERIDRRKAWLERVKQARIARGRELWERRAAKWGRKKPTVEEAPAEVPPEEEAPKGKAPVEAPPKEEAPKEESIEAKPSEAMPPALFPE